MAEQRWIFVVQALDKPGTLTAAAAVFSNRGISLEGILGSGIAPASTDGGRLIIRFRATLAKQKLLRQALERLASISHVGVYTENDQRLRAIAVAKLGTRAEVSCPPNAVMETILQTEAEHTVMLTGTPAAVETALTEFRQQAQLLDVVTAYIAI